MAEAESPVREPPAEPSGGRRARDRSSTALPSPTAAEPPVAEARLRTSLEWLDADCERAVDERCAVADSSARARAAVSARWSHRYAPTQCDAPKMQDSNVEGKRE